MLRTIRLTLAVIFFALITLLFLDFTGTLHVWFGWMAKIQFLPAVLALNIGVVLFLAVLTLVFGRIYCSVICPLGVFQDIVSLLSAKRKKNRFRYSSALKWLRYGVLGVFVLAIIGGLNSFVGEHRNNNGNDTRLRRHRNCHQPRPGVSERHRHRTGDTFGMNQ